MKRKKRGTQTNIRISQNTTSLLSLSGRNSSGKNIFFISILSSFLLSVIAVVIIIFILSKDLPSLEKLERIDPKMASQVYAVDGELIYSFFRVENRKFVPFDKIPSSVINKYQWDSPFSN